MKTSLKIPAQKSSQIVCYIFWDLYKIWTPFLTLNIFSKLGLEANIALAQVRFPIGVVAAYLQESQNQKRRGEKKGSCHSVHDLQAFMVLSIAANTLPHV